MSKVHELITVTSVGSHDDIKDHEIDLQAIASQAISIGEVGVDLSEEQKLFILRRMNYEGLISLDNLPVEVLFMIEKIQALPVEEAIAILKEAILEHQDDVNVSLEDIELFKNLDEGMPADFTPQVHHGEHAEKAGEIKVKAANFDDSLGSILESSNLDYHVIFDWTLQVKVEAALIAYHSPYPEVRAVTDPFDDPEQPCETLRAYIIGFVWCAIGSFINQFFSERQPSIGFSGSVAQLFIYPSGELLAFILPKYKFSILGLNIDLNPGKWNYKEQMFSTIIFSVAGGTSYVGSNIVVQKSPRFYANEWVSWGYQILLILSTNFLGFGFAGVLRRFSVYPVKALWPSLLPILALNRALTRPTKKENVNGWTISRYWFFITTCAASFLYYWVPDYLFQALSMFNWITWISPNNATLANITGSVSGLGLNPITSFDWNVISSNSPLWVPFYSQVNQYIGMLIGLVCIAAVYYSNYKWTGYLPINSNSAFSNTGDYYSVREILNEEGLLDNAKYQVYGPPFYTAANLVLYGAFFAIYPFAIIYEALTNYKTYYSSFKSIWKSVKNFKDHASAYDDEHDPHSTMMARYKEVPDWCFVVVLLISLVLAIVMVEVYPQTETPVWSLFFALAINFVFLVPINMIAATTGYSFGLNVLVELIVGYAIPNNSQALMIIKAFGYNIDGQAQNYITDQKMAHYAKLPPRAIFRGQMISVLMSSFIQLAIINWQLQSVEDYCSPHQKDKFTCPGSTTFFVASVIWGSIGPKKVFSGLYPILQWCFLIGAVLAPICWALKFYFPKQLKYFQPTLIIGGILIYAPYNLSYYTMGMYVSYLFMSYLRKHYLTWWNKYNYVLSGGLDAGIAFAGIIIFFAVQYHDRSISWWGNNVTNAGLDGLGEGVFQNVTDAPDGYFGPRIGHFP